MAAQHEQVLSTKPDGLSLIFKAHEVEGENWLL